MLVEGQEDMEARHCAPEGPSGGLSGNQSPGFILPCTPSWRGRSGGSQGPESEGTGKGSVLGLDSAVCSGPQGGWASCWSTGLGLQEAAPFSALSPASYVSLGGSSAVPGPPWQAHK